MLGVRLQGTLSRLKAYSTTALGGEVRYECVVGSQSVPLTPGSQLRIIPEGGIVCQHCQRPTRKSYQQGYCYPCFTRLAACDLCVLKPEQCHYAEGTCREPAWGEQHCMVPHWVYLANSTGVKVGITRKSQGILRWMDQGAVAALPVFEVSSRYYSGLIEVAMAEYVPDKTQWRALLRGAPAAVDLLAVRDELLQRCAATLSALDLRFPGGRLRMDSPVCHFEYPVQKYPEKIKALSLDNHNTVEGELWGIKGQYLLLSTGVFNVRNFSAYQVTLEVF